MTNTPSFIPGAILPGKKKEPYHVEHNTDVHDKDYMTSDKLDFNGSGFLYRMATRAISELENEVPSAPFDKRIKELTNLAKYETLLRSAQKVADILDEDLRSGISAASDEIKPYLTERKQKLITLINQRKQVLVQSHPDYFNNHLIEIP